MSAAVGSLSRCGSNSAIPSTVCPVVQWSTIKLSVCTEDFPRSSRKWNKLRTSPAPVMSLTRDYCVIFFGLILIRALLYVAHRIDLFLEVLSLYQCDDFTLPHLPLTFIPFCQSLLSGLGREWPWCLVHLWRWRCPPVPSSTWFGLGCASSPSCGGWVWVFRRPRIGDGLFSTQLLRRVR